MHIGKKTPEILLPGIKHITSYPYELDGVVMICNIEILASLAEGLGKEAETGFVDLPAPATIEAMRICDVNRGQRPLPRKKSALPKLPRKIQTLWEQAPAREKKTRKAPDKIA